MAIDPSQQTNDEWLAAYDGNPIEQIGPVGTTSQKTAELLFRYVDHRTTKLGSVVLEFQSLDDMLHAVKFFNVNLSSGGKPYPSGNRGQFNPPSRGTFRKFWLQAVGKPPIRWSRVHKSMRSNLGSLIFTGEIIESVDTGGNRYFKLSKIRAKTGYETGTSLAQSGHNLGTKWAQD